MTHGRWLGYAALAVSLSACVTINVYFPAAATQRAADRIIQGVYGAKPGAAKPGAPVPTPGTPQGRAVPGDGPLVALLDFVIPPARAGADLDIRTPTIQAIRASLAVRHARLEPFYAGGAVGITRAGLLTVRDLAAVPLPRRNLVRRLVAEDNRDRNALYQAIAAANGHPEWESEIRRVFARRWIANAPAGWWYQAADGTWRRKK
ncbi:hypothetical protein BMS3Bbin12_00708 [bacterium BMS3Bbin12]|nr:hypothetical protein BMS3Abin12_00117 [bacterium BMS3Abin12]GBE47546.1 hypothetical protein BMS3Bbin12_00708 [bacterium BMS3Bbin12]GBE50975.1 hypothetical protein BMS3Bbin13_01928 [bacterium BMS3Bbin13]